MSKFHYVRFNAYCYSKTDRHLKVRSGEHISISPLTFHKIKPSAESSIGDHLLFCNNDPSFDDFTILTQETKMCLLEIKESLLIQHGKPISKETAVPLHYFIRQGVI